MDTASSLWVKSQPTLLANMTDISYTTWVKPLSPVAVDEESLVLQCDSDMIRNTLMRVFSDSIRDCVNVANGTSLSLTFITPGERSQYVTDDEEEPDRDPKILLNPRYTFENFIVGSSNNFAHAAAMAVADSPSSAYNPLFIYGGVGLGKTHLMHAVGNRIMQKDKRRKIVYVTSETFTYELIESIGSNSMSAFRSKYRMTDVLMVDDIQFIAGKTQTQEEFFNTFNALHMAGKQIILNSDRPPKDLKTLEERLRSRFEGGLIMDIQPPDLEMRIAILKLKAKQKGITLREPVLMYIAEHVTSNIRQLEGSFNRIVSYADFSKGPVTVDMAASVLSGVVPGYEQKTLTIEDIQRSVADYYDVDIPSMISQRRTMDITFPRQVAMYICKTMLDVSLKSIGAKFGKRDHTTVMNACTKIETRMEQDDQFRGIVSDLMKRIESEQE